ncbi:MAG: hypothetical protein HQL72_03765 [Magnetococcales bacterium]|nr:hypothetical protein [Magnetococcales bacterium]
MSQHYSTQSFFRKAPNALLQRYFSKEGVLTDFEFDKLKEGNPKPLFDAWLELPVEKRNTMDGAFQDIFRLSCEKGFNAIKDEAKWHLEEGFEEFILKMSGLKNHCERAFITFLDHSGYWPGALMFYHADTLSSWRKRKNIPKVAAKCDDANLWDLARQIKEYFNSTEGRGRNCVVEALRRKDKDYFFAYPEDYSQHSIEWVEGEFQPRPHNPAFEIIFVYTQSEGTLDLHFKGNMKAKEALQYYFVETILGELELQPEEDDERVYDLNPLRNREFSFQYDPESGIQSVKVKRMRLSSKLRKGDRITLEADIKETDKAVYDLLDNLAESVSVDMYNVTRVELVASIDRGGDKKPKNELFSVTFPNSCSLKYDDMGLKLRAMLEASGIEPKEEDK